MKSKDYQISLAITFYHKCESFGKGALKGLLCECLACSLSVYCVRDFVNMKVGSPLFKVLQKIEDEICDPPQENR